jgi:outer membrane lipoprotein LolB
MKILHLLVAFGFAAIMQGCASIAKPETSINIASLKLYQQHQENLKTIERFTLKGRIGVQTEGKGFSGSLIWQHNSADDDIELYSPFGGQVASIKRTSDKVTLEDAKGNSISASDAETLTQNTLGWQLPLNGLSAWSLGRPTSSPILDSSWDEFGHLSTLKQDGWDIEYQNYSEQNGHFLPSKIVLKSNKVNLKLLVENWMSITSSNINTTEIFK